LNAYLESIEPSSSTFRSLDPTKIPELKQALDNLYTTKRVEFSDPVIYGEEEINSLPVKTQIFNDASQIFKLINPDNRDAVYQAYSDLSPEALTYFAENPRLSSLSFNVSYPGYDFTEHPGVKGGVRGDLSELSGQEVTNRSSIFADSLKNRMQYLDNYKMTPEEIARLSGNIQQGLSSIFKSAPENTVLVNNPDSPARARVYSKFANYSSPDEANNQFVQKGPRGSLRPVQITDPNSPMFGDYNFNPYTKDPVTFLQEFINPQWTSEVKNLPVFQKQLVEKRPVSDLFSDNAREVITNTALNSLPKDLTEWWNTGRDARVSNESNASWGELLRDDRNQLTRTDAAFEAGETGLKGVRPFKAFTPGMIKTGPTPAVRQAFERPVRAVLRNPASSLPGLADLIPSPEAIQTGYKQGPAAMGQQMGREFFQNLPTSAAFAGALSTPVLAPLAPGVGLGFVGSAAVNAANEVVRQETGEGIVPKVRQFIGTAPRTNVAGKPRMAEAPLTAEIKPLSAQGKTEMTRRQNRNELEKRLDLVKERFNPRKGEFGLSELLFGR